MVLMHKTCIFTKPVFTDVNTRYARATQEESDEEVVQERDGREKEREREERRGPHRAATPFIYFTPADG